MDIVVKGRNVEVPEHYRVHVAEKLSRLERYDKKVIRFDVELFHEPNRRQAKVCQRIEITGKGRGPAVRAEACAADFYCALDTAVAKLENRLRKMHDRRRVHHGRRRPASVAAATADQQPAPTEPALDGHSNGHQNGQTNGQTNGTRPASRTAVLESAVEIPEHDNNAAAVVPEPRAGEFYPAESSQAESYADEYADADYGPGQIVRRKEHQAKPISVDQALYQMELVGHDFYLFRDAESGAPSVVYRRKGFDYGVIALA
jgi:ribosomal subunit interface protein